MGRWARVMCDGQRVSSSSGTWKTVDDLEVLWIWLEDVAWRGACQTLCGVMGVGGKAYAVVRKNREVYVGFLSC